MILIYDAETTGLPLWHVPSEHPDQPHILELAALMVDEETWKIEQEISLIVEPEGWSIPEEVTAMTGISELMANDIGLHEPEVLSIFFGMWEQCHFRVAHNESFDARIIRIAQKRYGWSSLAQDTWKVGHAFCTMRKSTDICRLPRADGKPGFKFPKREEAYRHFTGRAVELGESHRALVDARQCLEIYRVMRGMELVSERQREILRHALGLSQSGREYRNRYCPGGPDITDCQTLINMGMMEKPEVDLIPVAFYTVTDEGKRIARAG